MCKVVRLRPEIGPAMITDSLELFCDTLDKIDDRMLIELAGDERAAAAVLRLWRKSALLKRKVGVRQQFPEIG